MRRALAGLLTLVIMMIVASGAHATESSCALTAKTVGDDFVDLLKSPADWDTGQWVAFGALTGATAGLIAGGDEAIARVAQEDPESFPYVIFHRLAWLGKWYGRNDYNPVIAFGIIAGGMWIAGEANDDDYLRRTAEITAESYLFTAAITVATKFLFGRARPYADEGARSWRFLGLQGRSHRAFPSGHSASAFAMATPIAQRHKDWWVQVPTWTLAAGAAAERVDSNKHWASDVIVGAALGAAVGAFLTHRHSCSDGGNGNPAYLSVGFDF